MRVSYAVGGLLAASTTMATSYNPQHLVIGTDGTVIVGADPSLYFQTNKYQINRDQDELEIIRPVEIDAEIQHPNPIVSDELTLAMLPTVHDELLPVVVDDVDSYIQQTNGDDLYSSAIMLQDTSPMPWNTLALTEDSEFPGVYGSVVFAELLLLCCIYRVLMRSIPLWIGFSRGQKCCLVVAFSMAILYQFAALGWFFGAVTPELMLGLSSLITRMISLGMVPIATTSLCQEHATPTPSGRRKLRSSRRHHARARSC